MGIVSIVVIVNYLSLGLFRLRSFAWDLSLGTFRLGTCLAGLTRWASWLGWLGWLGWLASNLLGEPLGRELGEPLGANCGHWN